jgi:predicted PurR-regulated permease PerM
MESGNIGGRRFRTAFVIILVVAVSALFLAVTWPFLKPLLLGALLAGLCHPLYRWITRLLRGRRSLGAIVTLMILFIIVAGPLSAFLGVVVQQALAVSNQALPWVQQHFGAASTFNAHDWLVQRFPALADHVPSQEQLVDSVGAAAKSIGGFLVTVASRMTATTAVFLLNLFVMVYAMFFFLKDGEKILEKIFYYMPLSDEDEALILQRFNSIQAQPSREHSLSVSSRALSPVSRSGSRASMAPRSGARSWRSFRLCRGSARPSSGCRP